MKILIIYKSHTGFTEQYAKWIGEALDCDITGYKDCDITKLMYYDVVIYGGRVHAGKIDGLEKIKKLITVAGHTKLVVFATGATPAETSEVIETMWRRNFSEEELTSIPHFYMQSGLKYEKMGILDRTIMKMMSRMLNKKKGKSEVEAGCQEAISSSYDICSKEYIVPLVEWVNKAYE